MEQRMKEILNQVAEIGQRLGQTKEDTPVPSIEVDLILEKIRQLYDNVRNLNSYSPDSSQTPPVEKQEIHHPEKETIVAPATEPVAQPSQEPVTESVPEQAPESVPGKTKQEPKILADKYTGGQKYINETLTQNGNKQDITSKLQSKPIKDIKSSLGINDRFTLIKELFNGDKDSFENTMGILDDAGNFNEAFNYINTSFEWDMEDEAVQMLLDLVRRKFIMKKDD